MDHQIELTPGEQKDNFKTMVEREESTQKKNLQLMDPSNTIEVSRP